MTLEDAASAYASATALDAKRAALSQVYRIVVGCVDLIRLAENEPGQVGIDARNYRSAIAETAGK